ATQSLVILGRFHPLLFPPRLEGPSPPLRFHLRTPNRFRRLLFGDCLQAHIEQGNHPREFGLMVNRARVDETEMLAAADHVRNKEAGNSIIPLDDFAALRVDAKTP